VKLKFNRINTAFLIFSFVFSIGAFESAKAQRKKTQTASSSNASQIVQIPEINFVVAMPKPASHLLEVEMRLRYNGNAPASVEVKMPVWTPGSYLIREYARHVLDFSAQTASGALPLQWTKINKNTWQIQNAAGNNEIVIKYRVYANELTVRTNELNDEHAFFTPAALLMHPAGMINAASTIKVVPFGDWKVATALEATSEANTFRAENFDILYDSPFEVGNFTEINFQVLNKPHRFVIEGEGNYDLERIRADVPRIVETAAQIFGGELPYKNYLFILNLRGGGGLEHLNSTALQFSRFGFRNNYKGFLELVAHEYFHLWNVKRIKPENLGPFDYSNENYTRDLWLAEGGTDYYSEQILLRAGLTSPREYLENYARAIAVLQNTPGRFQTSLEEASFDAWIKNYRPDENTINREISYYSKGDIVTMLLDLTIRARTNGAKNMDDVMRLLWENFGKTGKNYNPREVQKAAEAVAGASLEDFFANYVRGRKEIDYNSFFEPFGLRLETAVANARAQAFLGANFRGADLTIATIPVGTPAYDGGLNTGDQILAIDNYKIASPQELNIRLAERQPGDKIKLTFYRFDRLRETEITLGGKAAEQYRFVTVQNATEAQNQLRRGWLGAESK
jgi:predicted metalloprotease with PDZ domain